MMSYIYGFFSSGIVFAALHAVFPARAVDEFVKNDMTAAEVQRHFSERWEKDSPEVVRCSGQDSEKDGEARKESSAESQGSGKSLKKSG